jgi:hypothetical protein
MYKTLLKKFFAETFSRWFLVLGLLVTVPSSLLVLMSISTVASEISPYHFLDGEQFQLVSRFARTNDLAALKRIGAALESDKKLKETTITYRRLLQIQRVEEQLSDIFRAGVIVTFTGLLADVAFKKARLKLTAAKSVRLSLFCR